MKTMTTEQLRWTMKDLTNVIMAQEAMVREGHTCPKLGKYWDEFFVVESELRMRMRTGECVVAYRGAL